MKTDLRKVIAFILVIILCAAATVTGFAVSAADRSDRLAADSKTAGSDPRPALKDGVWQAVYENDDNKLFFINSEEHSFSLINADMGIGIPSRFDYDASTGIYKLQIGYEGNEESWRVIDNSGGAATVSDARGDLITLYYIAGESFDSFRYYSLYELKEMARAYYEAHQGSSEGVDFTAAMLNDGSFHAVITAEKNGTEAASYTVDMTTAAGTDSSYNAVDLSPYTVFGS